MTAGTHGSPIWRQPAGLRLSVHAVMDVITEDGFLEGVRARAGFLRQKLEGLVGAHPDVFEGVRGAGLMLGIKCKATNTDVVAAGYDAEILTVPAGDNVIRILPALTITEAEIAEGIARLDAAATAVSRKIAAE